MSFLCLLFFFRIPSRFRLRPHRLDGGALSATSRGSDRVQRRKSGDGSRSLRGRDEAHLSNNAHHQQQRRARSSRWSGRVRKTISLASLRLHQLLHAFPDHDLLQVRRQGPQKRHPRKSRARTTRETTLRPPELSRASSPQSIHTVTCNAYIIVPGTYIHMHIDPCIYVLEDVRIRAGPYVCTNCQSALSLSLS